MPYLYGPTGADYVVTAPRVSYTTTSAVGFPLTRVTGRGTIVNTDDVPQDVLDTWLNDGTITIYTEPTAPDVHHFLYGG